MNVLVGVALLFLALFIIGFVFGCIENRKIRKGEKQPEPSRVVYSYRVPSVFEMFRGRGREK